MDEKQMRSYEFKLITVDIHIQSITIPTKICVINKRVIGLVYCLVLGFLSHSTRRGT